MLRLFLLISLMGCQGLFDSQAKTPEQNVPTIYTIPETSTKKGPKINQTSDQK